MRFLLLAFLVSCSSKWEYCEKENGYCGDSAEFYDSDGDGYADAYSYLGDDCDDNDAAVNPGGAIVCDGSVPDGNCDNVSDVLQCDEDGDGFTTEGGDCNDGDRDSYPGAVEFCGDAVNQDCDEYADDRSDPSCTDTDTGDSGV